MIGIQKQASMVHILQTDFGHDRPRVIRGNRARTYLDLLSVLEYCTNLIHHVVQLSATIAS